MSNATQRLICRWIHIAFGLPLIGFVYANPADVLPYRDMFRFVFMPVLLLSGVWMWRGPMVMRMLSKKSA